jgi:hypothetical protein
MADDTKSADGKGTPKSVEGVTIAPRPLTGRNIPGGSMEAAAQAIGMNAIDRDMLPSGGFSTGQQWFQDSPDLP